MSASAVPLIREVDALGRIPRRAFQALAEAPEPGVLTLAQGGEGAPDTLACRVAGVHAAPGFGAVFDRSGGVYRATAGGALACAADLTCLPAVPAHAPELEAAAVWLAWGGTFNYGHFLLDGLSSLLALDELGLLARCPPLAPPLAPWQRDLLRLGFAGLAVTETAAPVVRLRQAAFATSMDHFLNAPNTLLLRLRRRMLGGGPTAKGGGRWLYLSRRGHPMRVMINEAELETALRDRGFTVLQPERLSVADQLAQFRAATVIVGPTGAAFANALFAPERALVVDIQPENFRSDWIAHLRRMIGLKGYSHLCPSPLPEREAPFIARLRRGYRFAYRLPLASFLAELDARL